MYEAQTREHYGRCSDNLVPLTQKILCFLVFGSCLLLSASPQRSLGHSLHTRAPTCILEHTEQRLLQQTDRFREAFFCHVPRQLVVHAVFDVQQRRTQNQEVRRRNKHQSPCMLFKKCTIQTIPESSVLYALMGLLQYLREMGCCVQTSCLQIQ